MKKYLIALLLCLMATKSIAANFPIDNPVLKTGSGSAERNAAFVQEITSNSVSIVSGNMETLTPFKASFSIAEVSATSFISFNVSTTNPTYIAPWSLSLVNISDNQSVLTLNSDSYSNAFISVVPTQIEANTAYKLIIQGPLAFDGSSGRNLSVFISDIVVSEVPLPAAAWLFGSALIGGLAFKRKIKKLNA